MPKAIEEAWPIDPTQ